MYDLDELRRDQFPLSSTQAYFDHASISPLPQAVMQRVQHAVNGLAEGPSHFFHEEALPLLDSLGEQIRAYLNAESVHEVVPVTTTSAALSAVATAIPWEPGDNVVFSELEFPSNAFPWMTLPAEEVEARIVPARDGGLTLEGLLPYVDERTRVVAASAIQ
ncbi:MAG: aminotransferase class V-fold PLP-dependent enzyme, partial [Anaerolineae bacterium]|nr:aminotransferase class V-fold PLP-dependent enzyme [Anaerolineae bacterium]